MVPLCITKKIVEDNNEPRSRPIVIFCTCGKKSRDDNKPIWTTTPSQNKIEKFFLSKKIKLRAEHYLETFFALLVLCHLVKFMVLLKATKRCATMNIILLQFSRISTTNHMKISQNFQRSP